MNRFPIEKMSKVLRVSRSGYYGWLNADPSVKALMDGFFVEDYFVLT